MREQAQLLQQQDSELEQLGRGVQRVKALAGVMKSELDEQALILDDLDQDIGRADGAMHSMNKRLKGLVEQTQSSERAQWSIIVCLLGLLAVLTFMVLAD